MKKCWSFPPSHYRRAWDLVTQAFSQDYYFLYLNFHHRLRCGTVIPFYNHVTPVNADKVKYFLPHATSDIHVYDLNPELGKQY